MANRHILHKTKLIDFKTWLLNNGWEITPNKGDYEVLRASKKTERFPLIIYDRNTVLEHYTVQDRACGIVKEYLKRKG